MRNLCDNYFCFINFIFCISDLYLSSFNSHRTKQSTNVSWRHITLLHKKPHDMHLIWKAEQKIQVQSSIQSHRAGNSSPKIINIVSIITTCKCRHNIVIISNVLYTIIAWVYSTWPGCDLCGIMKE